MSSITWTLLRFLNFYKAFAGCLASVWPNTVLWPEPTVHMSMVALSAILGVLCIFHKLHGFFQKGGLLGFSFHQHCDFQAQTVGTFFLGQVSGYCFVAWITCIID